MTLLRECPRCKKKNDQELKECIDCGIVFEEYFKKRKKRLEEVQNIVSNGRFDEAIMYLTKIQNEYPEISAKCKENITILKNKKLKVPASDGRDLLDELIREFKVKKSNKLRKKFEALAIEYPTLKDECGKYVNKIFAMPTPKKFKKIQKPKNTATQEGNSMSKHPYWTYLGYLLIITGIIGLISSLAMETSVTSSFSVNSMGLNANRTINIGLINDRLCYLIVSCLSINIGFNIIK